MYDESIEDGDDEYEDWTTPRYGITPTTSTQRLPRSFHHSIASPSLSKEELEMMAKISSKDFIPPAPPSTRPQLGPDNILPEKGFALAAPALRKPPEAVASFGGPQQQEKKGLEPASNNSEPSKTRSVSPLPSEEGDAASDDDDDEDDEYDDINSAQIEGLLMGQGDFENSSSAESVGSLDSVEEQMLGEATQYMSDELLGPSPRKTGSYDHLADLMAHYSSPLTNYSPNTGVVPDELELIQENMKLFQVHHKLHEIKLESKRDDLRKRVCALSSNPGILGHGYCMYNPADYENLKVSPDIKELFQYITKYATSSGNTQIDVKLRPFIPEYYPSVGDIDAFIKVVHPEIKNDGLGIKCLDEPSAFQSDPSVLDLRLRALAKQSSAKAVVVKKVENVSKNTKIIENWIKDISDLHRSKPSPSVHYSKPMPDIDLLIQEWPPEIEDLLKVINFPSSDLECDLSAYVDIVCNLLDIPVYKSRIQSLHVLCTLYATQKHFNQYGPLGNNETDLLPSANSMRLDEVDRLQL